MFCRLPLSLFRKFTLLLFSSAAAVAAPVAQDLQEIARRGEVVIGVREVAVPFSYLDKGGAASGYSVAICNRVADKLKAVLNKPDLRVRYNSVTLVSRFLLIQEGVIDLECGATSHTLDRERLASFSVAFGVEQAQLISRKSLAVKSFDDLAGKKLLASAGSSGLELLQAAQTAGTLKAEIIPVRNAVRAYYALKDNKADAYFGSGEIFLGEILRHGGVATDFNVITPPGRTDPLAVMMRKDRAGLKSVVDETLLELAKSGELRKIYQTWFELPIPEYGLGLGLAPTLAWQSMLETPHDRPAE